MKPRQKESAVIFKYEGGRMVRLEKIGSKFFADTWENGRRIRRQPVGKGENHLITLGVKMTETGDGIKRTPRPCLDCGSHMEHLPTVCTGWLPNGTYLCSHCGCHWLGSVGIVDVDVVQTNSTSKVTQ